MIGSETSLNERLNRLRPLAGQTRPVRGWVRAIREALGMTTAQLGRRMGVSQPRIVKLEQAELDGSLTLASLERAAQALGCRVVYALVPEKSLTETIDARATLIADHQLAAVEQTMRLEDQEVPGRRQCDETRERLRRELLRRKARLWDEME